VFDVLVLFIPLILVVSVVYAAAKHEGTRTIVYQALHLFTVTLAGLAGLAAVIYLICRFVQPTTWF
jgi:hypothetical protein